MDLQLVPLPSTAPRLSTQLPSMAVFRPMCAGTMDVGFQPLPIPLCDAPQKESESLPTPEQTMPRKRQTKGCQADKTKSKSRSRKSTKGSTSKGSKRSKVPTEPTPRKQVRTTLKPKKTSVIRNQRRSSPGSGVRSQKKMIQSTLNSRKLN